MAQDFAPELIIKAQQGDQKARNEILERLQVILRAYFTKRIGYKTEVEDLIQNTLVRVHRSLEKLQRPDRFKAFALKAALFELQDLYRGRYGPKEQLYDPDYAPEQIVQPEQVGLRVDLEKLMEVLTPKAREIVSLRQYGYRYEEIANMLGTTEAAVKMQVKRAFDKLRNILQNTLLSILFTGCYFYLTYFG